MADMSHIVQSQVLQAAKAVEEQLDAELGRLEKLNVDELEELREKRLEQLKKQSKQKQEWLALGHGEYSEIPEEKDFFDIAKKSSNVVCHFYKNDSPRCKIVDHHLKILAPKHLETKFCKIDAEKCPFLTQRLRIKVIPSMALIKDSVTKDYIVGFTDLGNHDEFSTEMLEWRLAHGNVLNYSGDLLTPPDSAKAKKKTNLLIGAKKTIRGRDSDDDDSD